MGATFTTFDAAEYLDSDEAIAAYLNEAMKDGDPDLLLSALSDIARARGMTKIAEDSGLGRESLYKALRPGAKPGFARSQDSGRAWCALRCHASKRRADQASSRKSPNTSHGRKERGQEEDCEEEADDPRSRNRLRAFQQTPAKRKGPTQSGLFFESWYR